jgi:hypothetical protein
METGNTFDDTKRSRRHDWSSGMGTGSRIWAGSLVVIIGVVLLARQAGADLPHWLVSWPMIPIVVGLFIGIRHSFKNPGWIFPVLVGSIFLINEFDPTLNMGHYVWPAVVIAIGLMIMFKPKKKMTEWNRPGEYHMDPNAEIKASMASNTPLSSEDYLDSVTIFGGVKKNIFSKTFRGGELVTIFGGTEINLTQADVPHPIVLDITQIFGGAKLIIPPHWKIQSEEIVSIFGSVEDKRPVLPESNYDSGKVLVLKGTNIFGGIDIKSY